MNPFDFPANRPELTDVATARPEDPQLRHQREVLRYISDIGSSLRLQMDTATLLRRVSEASCKALGFHYSVLYLADDKGNFCASASSGISEESEEYLRQHPLPAEVVALLTNRFYRISRSYFIPREAPLWQDDYIASFFIVDASNSGVVDAAQDFPPTLYGSQRTCLSCRFLRAMARCSVF